MAAPARLYTAPTATRRHCDVMEHRLFDPATNEGQLLSAAIAQHDAGQLRQAEELYARVVRINRRNHEALQRWALAKQAQGQFRDALQLLDKAIHINPNAPSAHCNRGYVLQDLGRRKEAIASLERAVRLKPDFLAAHIGLGTLHAELGDVQNACASFDTAVQIDPRAVEVVLNKGILFEQHDRLDAAIETFDAALRIAPGDPNILLHKAACLRRQGELAEALRVCDAGLAARQDLAALAFEKGLVLAESGKHADAIVAFEAAARLNHTVDASYHNIGNCLRELDRLPDARSAYERAIALGANYVEVFNGLGVVLRRLQQPLDALSAFDRAVSIQPNDQEALLYRAETLFELDRPTEALAAYDRAMAACPDSPDVLNSLGNALQALGRYDEALSCFTKALAIEPKHLHALLNIASTLRVLGRYDEALERCAEALAIKPDSADAHLNAAMCRLATGDFAAGWKLFEWRWEMAAMRGERRQFEVPMWLGETDLAGRTLLVHAEQGFGDTLQFCRYLPLLPPAGRIIFQVQRPLLRLMASLPRAMTLIAEGEALPAFDLYCPLLSLPLACGTTLDTIPHDVPYLRVPADHAATWRDRLGPRVGLRVGLAWWGLQHITKRSIPLPSLEPLLLVPGIEYHALHQEIPPSHRDWLAATGKLTFHGEQLADFADTAALIAEMDLVVTIDTSVAHLAGALGKPVWVLLKNDADWRWLCGRTDSPWYPTARLFRQPAPGDWAGVIERVRAELDGLAQSHRGQRPPAAPAAPVIGG
jgi:tetratricopeptide (TPR) repeat protein